MKSIEIIIIAFCVVKSVLNLQCLSKSNGEFKIECSNRTLDDKYTDCEVGFEDIEINNLYIDPNCLWGKDLDEFLKTMNTSIHKLIIRPAFTKNTIDEEKAEIELPGNMTLFQNLQNVTTLELKHIQKINPSAKQIWPKKLNTMELIDVRKITILPKLDNTNITKLIISDYNNNLNISNIKYLKKLKKLKLHSSLKFLFDYLNENSALTELFVWVDSNQFEKLKNLEKLKELKRLTLKPLRNSSCSFVPFKNVRLTYFNFDAEYCMNKTIEIPEDSLESSSGSLEELQIKNTNLDFDSLFEKLASKFQKLKILSLKNNAISYLDKPESFPKHLEKIELQGDPNHPVYGNIFNLSKCCDTLKVLKSIQLRNVSISPDNICEDKIQECISSTTSTYKTTTRTTTSVGKVEIIYANMKDTQTNWSKVMPAIIVLSIVIAVSTVLYRKYRRRLVLNTKNYRIDVFYIYNVEDKQVLEHIMENLEQVFNTKDEATEGLIQPHYNMTCADVEFELGKSTNDQLAMILKESRIIVLLISKAFFQSNKNLMEMNMAIDSHSKRYMIISYL